MSARKGRKSTTAVTELGRITSDYENHCGNLWGHNLQHLLAGYGLTAKRKKVSLRWSSGVSQWNQRHSHRRNAKMPSCEVHKDRHHFCGVGRAKLRYLKLIKRKQSDGTEGHSTKYLFKMSEEAANCYRREESAEMPLPDGGCDRENTGHKGQRRARRQNVNTGCTRGLVMLNFLCLIIRLCLFKIKSCP